MSRARRAAAVVATGLSLALLSAGEAPAATQWSLVMYSDRGDHVGLGQPRTLDSGNSTLNLWSDPGSVTFWINCYGTGAVLN